MAIGDQDFGIFFNLGDFAHEVVDVATGVGFAAHVEYPESVDDFHGMTVKAGAIVSKPTIQYATVSAPMIGHDSLVQLDGKTWRVRFPRKTGDGAVSIAELAAA